MKYFVKLLFTFIFILTTLWTVGLFQFASNLSATEKSPAQTDAIVVLTGGEGRVSAGLRLLEAAPSSRLFVSGVSDGVTVDGLLSDLGEGAYPQALRKRITFGYKARTTVQNAWETAEWCDKEGVRSIRLVTAAYHMKRSLLELRPVMQKVNIVPHAVEPDSMKEKKWWYNSTSFILMAREYTKLLIAKVAHVFGLTTEDFR